VRRACWLDPNAALVIALKCLCESVVVAFWFNEVLVVWKEYASSISNERQLDLRLVSQTFTPNTDALLKAKRAEYMRHS
jgi:hypothetical protein